MLHLMAEGIGWRPTPDAGALELHDVVSGRSALVVRPVEDDLPGDLLVHVESVAFRWANLVTQAEAEHDVEALGGMTALRSLRALSWLLSLWAVVSEARSGTSAIDIARSVDYQGPWRRDRTADDAHMWEALTQRVRIGALAALTDDPEAMNAYRRAATEPSNVGPILVHHTLIVLDGFSQDMRRHDLDPRGLVAAFVAGTSPVTGTSRRRSFHPARSPERPS
jgi:hypothetical protein